MENMPKWNTVHHGDALETMRSWKPAIFDTVVADPPYMISVASDGYGKLNPWTDMCNGAFWFAEVYRNVKRLLTPDGCFWTFLNWRSVPTVQKAAYDAGWNITSLLVWDKDWIGPGGSQGLRPSYELVALLCNEDFAIKDRGLSDIKRFKWTGQKPTGHPAEKPEDLVRWILKASGSRRVLDPFMGSGTTAAAAASLGLEWAGIEDDAAWVASATTRAGAVSAQGQFGLST